MFSQGLTFLFLDLSEAPGKDESAQSDRMLSALKTNTLRLY